MRPPAGWSDWRETAGLPAYTTGHPAALVDRWRPPETAPGMSDWRTTGARRAVRVTVLSTGGHSNMELCELALHASLQAGDLGEAARCEEALTAAQNEFGYEPSPMGLELLAACRKMESRRDGGGAASTIT